MKPFQTLDPTGIPEWQKLYERLRLCAIGDVVTYDELGEILGRDFRQNRSPIYRAVAEMEEHDQRTAVAVPNVGMRIAEPAEHIDLARGHHSRARRQLFRSGRRLHAADRSRLTPEEIARVDALEENVSRHADLIRRLDERTARNERAVQATAADVKASQAQVERLTAALERAGIEVPE